MSLSSPIQPSTRYRLASRPRCCKSLRSRCHSKQNLKRSLHRNQQYSITAITDGSGAISERYAYSAYGTPTITDASGTTRTTTAIGNRYMYTGREWEETLSLYHYRARMYDPVGGRFVSRDPIGFRGSRWLLFEYLDSQPLGNLDPFGLEVINFHPDSIDYCRWEAYFKENPSDPGVLIVAGHANSDTFAQPTDDPRIYIPMTAEEMAEKIMKDEEYKPQITIVLYCCHAGKKKLACEVANVLKCTVVAYDTTIHMVDGKIYIRPRIADDGVEHPPIPFVPDCPPGKFWHTKFGCISHTGGSVK